VLLGIGVSSVVALGENECSAEGECSSEESSLLALRAQQDSETRRRLPPVQCTNREGNRFDCAGGDTCCGGACVGSGDVCCVNVNGDGFPCQGGGGGCCGNACYAPGSKCCQSPLVPRSRWYPVSEGTKCAFGEERPLQAGRTQHVSQTQRRMPPVHCTNREGNRFDCAGGDTCCGGACVGLGDVCCVNVNGDGFPCQGGGGGCCGNACFAPGSKCCQSPLVPRSRWYPVTEDTECAFGESSLLAAGAQQVSETRRRLPPVHCTNREGNRFECAGGDSCCRGACVGMGDVCCVNVNGDGFPCQGGGGGCCGNACFAPGSKCCQSPLVPRSRWYPVTEDTECAF